LPEDARRLLCAAAVRDSAERLLVLALADSLADWTVDLDRLGPTADFVARVVRERYPRLDVPVHSRWRHFVLSGHDLWDPIAVGARWNDADAAARSAFDLVIISVLLDAGAGAGWRYRDRDTGLHTRSEGLALASLRWFESGGLSADPRDPLRVDAAALRRVDLAAIERAFQAGEENRLAGLEGRAALLNRLGAALEARPDLFALADSPRPGGLFDALRKRIVNGRLAAATILELVLEALGPVWQGRPTLNGVALGDCWPHPALVGKRPADGYVPLHKLSQWLAYSLIEPLEHAGIAVSEVHELTGLAEYRNGGLFVDLGVLAMREPAARSALPVGAPLVVGWRALTIALLDRLAPLVRERLGLTPRQFPLASMLEGGTWAAGRIIASALRADGGPPIHILSDGTVF
jgi:hypothetical protein